MKVTANDQDAMVAVKPGLFVSYARADREKVRPLVDALIVAGYPLWWDALIAGGAAFATTIEGKLAAAEAVIVVWSANSVASDWVRDEAAHARDRKRLVPVTIDGAEPPLGFRQYHTIDLSRWNRRADAAEFASLEGGIAAAADAAVGLEYSAPVARTGVSRRALIVGGGGIAVVAAAAAVVTIKPWRQGVASNALAVLPFANLSGDRSQDYFSEGLCEEVRAALVRVAGLKVAAPTSSNEFRDHKEDAREIARKLGVGYLLDGNVRKSGNLVRIDVTLTDVAAGFASWSQSFDRKLDDIFALQSEIAVTVASALLSHVSTATGTAPGKAPGGTTVVAAYDAFLRGRALFNGDAGESADRAALARFEEAISLDPAFAAAHAARSRSLAGIASLYAKADRIVETYGAAVAAAQRAVALAPDLAAAHLALGYATLNGFLDFRGSRTAYDRAFALGQGDADILLMYAYFTAKAGRGEDARRVIVHAEQLDPLNPRTFRADSAIELATGNYRSAVARAEQALAMNAKLSSAHSQIGFARLMLADAGAARAAFAAEPLPILRLAGQAIVEHKLGNLPAAEAALAELVTQHGDNASYQQAQVLAQWGRTEGAFAALERAYDIRDGGMASTLVDPMFEPLRNDARYNRLLGRMGLA